MTNKFEAKAYEVETLGEIYRMLEDKLKNIEYDYIRTEVQETDSFGNPVWEDADETIPSMSTRWEFVLIPEEELSDSQIMKVQVCRKLMTLIEKQI